MALRSGEPKMIARTDGQQRDHDEGDDELLDDVVAPSRAGPRPGVESLPARGGVRSDAHGATS